MTDRRVHVNGELVPIDAASVSVEDRGFRYGDAAFETLRAYGGSIFAWEAHLDRLVETCKRLGMGDAIPSDLRSRVHETLSANGLTDAYVRVSVSRGVQSGTLAPKPIDFPTIVVLVKPLPRGGIRGESVWDAPATVETVETRRVPDQAIPSALKTHNYMNGILAREELSSEADEALMLDTTGAVAEGTVSNVFFVDDGTLKTPSTEGDVLPGITRSIVLEFAKEETFPIEVARYEPAAVKDASEVFLTNTTWEVRPVESLDGRRIETGPITKLLQRRYRERVEREHYR